MNQNVMKYVWGLLRIGMGWIFLWAFVDKVFGLGFATCRDAATGVVDMFCDKAWYAGGSPTFGFLNFASKGPFAEFYQGIAGNPIVDWLFMLGLLFVGTTLLLGICVRLGSYAGVAMMALMYSAGFIPPDNNPFVDDHIIYALVLIGLSLSGSGKVLGFGQQWSETALVRKFRIFE